MAESGSLLLPGAEDEDAAEFWRWCSLGELRIQRCESCATVRFPPRPMCPACQSFDHEWVALSGRGTVWSFVVAHPPLLPAYAERAPYNVVVVEADDRPGIRFVGNLVSSPDQLLGSIDPTSITIGEPVRVAFHRATDGLALPCWTRDST